MKDVSQSLTDSLSGGLNRFAGGVKGFFRRSLVHAAAVVLAVLSMLNSGAGSALPVSGKVAVGFAAYVGVINLFPRAANPLASGLGILLGLLLLVLGTPWQTILFWAGGTTLIVRLLTGTDPTGRPRSAIVVFAIAAVLLINRLAELPGGASLTGSGVWPPIWPFPLVLALGFALRAPFLRFRQNLRDRRERANLRMAVEASAQRMAALPGGNETVLAVHALAEQSETFLKLLPSERAPGAEDLVLLRRIAAFSATLPNQAKALVAHDEFTHDAAQALNAALQARRTVIIAESRPKPVLSTNVSPEQKEKLQAHTRQITAIREAANALPEAQAQPAVHICEQAEKILEHASQDVRDFPQADKFLSRYLEAARKLLTYTQPGTNGLKPDDAGMAGKDAVEAMLVRLADAFSAQYARLLENDAMDARVELGVIDKLLKMDGH